MSATTMDSSCVSGLKQVNVAETEAQPHQQTDALSRLLHAVHAITVITYISSSKVNQTWLTSEPSILHYYLYSSNSSCSFTCNKIK